MIRPLSRCQGADGEEFSDGQDAYYSARLPDDEGGSDSGENEEPEEESADGDGDENRNMLAFIQEHTACTCCVCARVRGCACLLVWSLLLHGGSGVSLSPLAPP